MGFQKLTFKKKKILQDSLWVPMAVVNYGETQLKEKKETPWLSNGHMNMSLLSPSHLDLEVKQICDKNTYIALTTHYASD